MISHNFRRQRRGSFCIRAYTASSDRCVAARVTRFPISFSSFPLIASFLEYHPDCESAWHLYIQFLTRIKPKKRTPPRLVTRPARCEPRGPLCTTAASGWTQWTTARSAQAVRARTSRYGRPTTYLPPPGDDRPPDGPFAASVVAGAGAVAPSARR